MDRRAVTAPQQNREKEDVPHVITEPCRGAKDGQCILVCPVDCIHPTAEERAFQQAEMLYIDPLTCVDCGLCVDECDRGAIFAQGAVPAQWLDYVRRNAEYYTRGSMAN
jgi:NAD-dependent dihydropyrimidine dehydrogenase PreA subunit